MLPDGKEEKEKDVFPCFNVSILHRKIKLIPRIAINKLKGDK